MQTIKLLNLREAASLLRAHPRTIVSWLRKGRLPGVKAPGGWRISAEQLESFVRGESQQLQASARH
jgi:excisionase family DNA binding protein